MNSFTFRTKVWLYHGQSAWHFISLPKMLSVKIKKMFLGLERGFGSLPIIARIGNTEWKTSIFPDKKAGVYLLPIKVKVRKVEEIKAGDKILITIVILF